METHIDDSETLQENHSPRLKNWDFIHTHQHKAVYAKCKASY